LVKAGLNIVSGGTDSHVMLVDLQPKGVTGKAAEASLERAHITCNKNGIPFDPLPPATTSGIRVGTPAGTTRGFGTAEFTQIGEWIGEVVDGLAKNGEDNSAVEAEIRRQVLALTARFPIYN
jgi:glycine hydroxymethyltransferase